MWCIKCQADVAAEMAPDNHRILCTSCGSPIRTVPMLPTEDKTRQARELLERWSKTRWSEEADESSDPPSEPRIELPQPKRAEPQAAPRAQTKAAFRLDEPRSEQGLIAMKRPSNTSASEASPRSAKSRPAASPQVASGPVFTQRTHDRHGFPAPPPHFADDPFAQDETPLPQSTSSKLQAFWGQMLAYAGVLTLTIGAAFVLLGYFGGPQWQSYAPTGWLITTTGQMLLFLGVVTLVSGGMEQTTEEVARRIDRLGHRMIRIEWAAQNHGLKGPSIPAEHFRPDGEEGEKARREEERSETATPVGI